MKTWKTLPHLFFLALCLWGCEQPLKFSEVISKQSPPQPPPPPLPPPPPPPPVPKPQKFETIETNKTFRIQASDQSFEQEQLEKNASFLSFQIKKPDGSFLADLNQAEVKFFENQLPISNYKFTKNSVEFAQTVDIVFTVDVTGSMEKTIEAAKLRLINFIRKSRDAGYHSRMCLVTFGDYTIKKCDKFYDNNPRDPATQDQVQELISEITKLRALKGPLDPGGQDFNENPMRALIDASLAPWQAGDQRFAILITDDGFLYSPENPGNVGPIAPKWKELKNALIGSQMKVFAATPSLKGYNFNFSKKELGIVDLTQGEWFPYSDLVSGKITLDSILNRILVNVNTTFVAEYVVEEQEGLDPTLPVSKRNLTVDLKDKTLGQVTSLQLKSNLPDGRKEYARQFKISEKKIDRSTLHVWINNQPVTDFELLQGNSIEFSKAPPAKAKIKVTYEYEEIKDSLILEPVEFQITPRDKTLEVFLNSVAVDNSYYTLHDVGSSPGGQVSAIGEGTIQTISFTDRVFAADDPLRIKTAKKLDLLIRIKRLKLPEGE